MAYNKAQLNKLRQNVAPLGMGTKFIYYTEETGERPEYDMEMVWFKKHKTAVDVSKAIKNSKESDWELNKENQYILKTDINGIETLIYVHFKETYQYFFTHYKPATVLIKLVPNEFYVGINE